MENFETNDPSEVKIISKKSWVAYVLPIVISTWLIIVLYQTYIVSALIPLVYMIYKIFMLRSYQLYLDSEGVWLFRGIFPWNKGTTGVKWRDLDEGVYFTGFFSWITKSYKVVLKHRFTKDSEIFLSHMQYGDQAVTEIYTQHQQYITE